MLRFAEVISAAKEQQIPVRGLVLCLLIVTWNEWKDTSNILLTFWFYAD